MVNLLLTAFPKTNVYAKNEKGQTAFDLATKEDIRNILESKFFFFPPRRNVAEVGQLILFFFPAKKKCCRGWSVNWFYFHFFSR